MSLRSRVFAQGKSLVRQLAGAGHVFNISHSHHACYSDLAGAAQSQTTAVRHYNEAIRSLSQRRSTAEQAILLYSQIRLHGLRPDAYSFTYALKAVATVGAVNMGKQIHGQAVKDGFDVNVYTGTALIQLYASGGCTVSAQKVFDEMPVRNVVAWTALISGYVNMNRPKEAIGVFRRMQGEGMEPDEVTLTAVLSACADLGALELGEWIHGYIIGHEIRRTTTLNNALIDMYAKSGHIGKAMEVFKELEWNRNVVTWTTMISGLAAHGLAREAMEMFTRMEQDGVEPNGVTFLAVLSACSHAGLVKLGRHYFHKMGSVHKIKPDIKHYACMVALLSRSGQLQEAEELAMSMPFKANAAIWGTILAASRIHGDAELASRAAGYLFSLEPENSGNYLLLSNTYAALGRWDQAANARKSLRDSCAKAQGSCWIEVDGEFYVFAAWDTLHPRREEVYEVLQKMYLVLKVAGFGLMEDGWPVKILDETGESDDLF